MSYFASIFIFFVGLPILLGMILAFFEGKKHASKGFKCSECVWQGYGKGIKTVFFSFLFLLLVVVIIALFNGIEALPVVVFWGLIWVVICCFISLIAGLLLFTFSAFFGFSIGNQKFIEAELVRKDQMTTDERANADKSHHFSNPSLK